jgi:thiol-disulfide isomerase/thioredoxin
MRTSSLKLFVLILIAINTLNAKSQKGHEIKIRIPSLKESRIILAHYFVKENSFYPDDTITLDKNGNGVFKKSNALPKGMYIIYLPNKSYFDLIIGDNQFFSIEADTVLSKNSVKFQHSPENKSLYEYREFINNKSIEASQLFLRKKESTSNTEKDSLTKEIEKINKNVLAYIDKKINEKKGTFFSKFLIAMKDIEVPDPPRDKDGKITDSMFQSRYYKSHYFDNFDYTDPSLLRTPVYERKVKDFIEKFIPQIPDSINKELDVILTKTRPNEEVFRYLLGTFFNHFAQSQIMGFDAIFVHISEKYYIPFATWADRDYIQKLQKEIAKRKPTLIGKVAPNLKLVTLPAEHFYDAKTDSALKSNPYAGNNLNIHDVKSQFTVIAFWEANCGHCKKTIPELYKVYADLKDKGVQVLSIHTMSNVEGKRKWIDFVNEHQLYDWINAWSPYSSEFKDIYDVYTTPVILVLDVNKRIIAKKISPEQIKEVIEAEFN